MSVSARRMTAGFTAAALIFSITAFNAPSVSAAPRTERYIVTTWDDEATDAAVANTETVGGETTRTYDTVLDGFAAELTDGQLAEVQSDPEVRSVVADGIVHTATIQRTTRWNLDRIDQRSKTPSGGYGFQTTGAGVTVFTVDTGIRFDHTQFGGRAVSGYDFVDLDNDASDCEGHGTHVAGTIGGSTYGVAQRAKIVAVRALDCEGSGYESDILASLEWVRKHRPAGPALVNMSLAGDPSNEIDAAAQAVIKAGIPVVVAAGNDDVNASSGSPARLPDAITVASSTSSDHRSSFSNWGSRIDVFAPGSSVVSAGRASPTATATGSGTSMAAPHVAGGVARYLQGHPKATPAQVRAALVGDATRGALQRLEGSPDRLLYLRRNVTGAPSATSTSRTSRTVTLKWSQPYGFGTWAATRYELRRSGTNRYGKPFKVVTLGSSARSYSFKDLKTDSRYTVTVRAVNSAGSSISAVESERTR